MRSGLFIRAAYDLCLLGVRDASALSVKHPLFPLCVRFALIPVNPCDLLPSAFVRFHSLSSARLPFDIPATSYPCPFFSVLFSHIFANFILSMSGADENGWSQPRKFARPLCPFCIRSTSVAQWDRAFRIQHGHISMDGGEGAVHNRAMFSVASLTLS